MTGLARFDAPAAGEISDGAALLQDAWVVIAAKALASLLAPFGSLVVV